MGKSFFRFSSSLCAATITDTGFWKSKSISFWFYETESVRKKTIGTKFEPTQTKPLRTKEFPKIT
jgi:hypothetical protein